MKTIFGFGLFFFFFVCYLPQVYKMIKDKTSAGVSSWQYVWTIGGYVFGLAYMFMTGFALFLMLNYLSGIAFCVLIIYLCKKYK